MVGPFQALFWIAEHWWILAIVAAVALAAVLWTGVVQLGAVVVALAKIIAAIAKFFATPADQIAAKILFGFVVAVLALSAGYYHRGYVDNAKWERIEAARAAAAEKVRAAAEREAEQAVAAAQTVEDTDATAIKQRIIDYARTLPKAVPDECRLTAADLAAAGVPDGGEPGAQGRHPAGVQQTPRARGAR